MSKDLTVFGHVNNQGKLSIYNVGIFKDVLHKRFAGSSIEMTIKKRFYEFSHKLRKYYFYILVPELQKGFLSQGMFMSREEVDNEMRERFLFYETYDEEKDKWEKHIHTLRMNETKVDNKMFLDFVEKCIIFAIQSLDWAIPYPREEFDDYKKTFNQIKTERKQLKENTL